MKQNYLDPNFNPSNLKVPELREILREHNVSYPRTANKKLLIDLFNSNVAEDQRVNTPGHKRVIGDTHLADAAPTAEGSAFKRARTSSVEPIAVAPHTTLSGQPQRINVPDTVKQRLYYSHFNHETFSCIQCGEFLFLITAAEFWEHLKAQHEHLIPNDLEPEGIPTVISSAHAESSSAQIGESSTAPLRNSRTYMDERSPAYEEIIPSHLRNVEESSSAQKEESRPAFLGESSSEIIPASLATQRNSTQTPQDVPAGNDDDFINREIAQLKMTEAQKIDLLLYLTKNNNVKAQVKSVLQNFTDDSIRLGYLTALAQAPTTSEEPNPAKKARYNNSLKDAIIRAGLVDKAIVNNIIKLSLLDKKEKVTVLEFLGEEVLYDDSPYRILFETACMLKKTGGQIQDIISVPDKMQALPVVNTRNLYVREVYKNLYSTVTENFLNDPGEGNSRIVVTGTSGIGKSVFLIYFAIRLLAESDGNNPPIIIFHTKENSKCYAFGGTSTIRFGRIDDFKAFLDRHETWYLVDSSPQPVLSKARTIISVSPKTLNSESNQYQDVSKQPLWTYYMAPWELNELERCRNGVNYFGIMSQDFMENLYNKIGGVPRYVLQSPMHALTKDPNDLVKAEKCAYARVKMAIDHVKDASILLQFLAEARESLEFSSRLLHRWPKNDGEDYYLKWASSHIQEAIVTQLKDQVWGDLLRNLVLNDKGISWGCLFELYILHIFRKGGYTFETKELNGTSSSLLSIPDCPLIKNFQKTEELSAPTDGNLFIPSISNFPAVDLFLAPDHLFQITVSLNHPVKEVHLKKIAETILGDDNNKELHLYFVVPDNIYDNFKAQAYLNENGKFSWNISAIV